MSEGMQQLSTVLAHINQVADAKGKAKEQVLATTPDLLLPSVKTVIDYALNPRITFGIAKKTITKIEEQGTCGIDALSVEHLTPLLDELATRRLTGNAAVQALVTLRAKHCSDTWELVKRILIKDLRASISAKTANRVWKEFIPMFEVQLAHKYEPKKIKEWPVDAEIKHDGVRCMAEINLTECTVTTYSRTGNEFHNFDSLKGDIFNLVQSALPTHQGVVYLDGEIKSGEFNKTSGDIHRKEADIDDAVFYVFDFLTADEFWTNSSPINHKRRKRLQALFMKAGVDLIAPERIEIEGVVESNGQGAQFGRVKLIEQYEVHSDEAAQALFGHFYGQGEEGIIIKPRYESYFRKRHNGFLKMKNAISEDLKIIGFEKGERDTKYEHHLGALVVDFNGVAVNVSSGLTHNARMEWWGKQEELLGRIIEVGAHEVTPDGSLRHPRFIRFRDSLTGEKE